VNANDWKSLSGATRWRLSATTAERQQNKEAHSGIEQYSANLLWPSGPDTKLQMMLDGA